MQRVNGGQIGPKFEMGEIAEIDIISNNDLIQQNDKYH